ncbi:hypothetical protein HN51_038278 [Arachis hypogaea]|uniref:Protein XRI1 n=1 Tax=Arachis hypogaea TaxID=3818 RepID=A0A444ZSQ8_ARAHY|nr:uncharacterized protein LOC112792465 [Arachis hypogaea]QHO03974.1 hypothetical protein DS421_13g436640 [Arachis hypogaea]RYR17196.1 hypothetical protein Ahy_B03g061975 [Arachis hypogaea]
MNDLHYSSLLLDSSSLDYHNLNLGVINADKFSLMMPAMYEYGSSSEPSFSTATQDSSADHHFSTGYLQDALLEFGDRSKRRRFLPNADNHHDQQYSNTSSSDLEKSLWNLNPTYCMNQNIESIFELSDEDIISTFWSRIMREEAKILVEEETTTTTTTNTTILSGSEEESPNSSSSSKLELVTKNDEEVVMRNKKKKEEEEEMKKSRSSRRRVVYPFAMVKPGGREGDVTLNEINERILMAPTRPVRHPVGDYACRPCVSAVQGSPGLSGKAVVALTRIHTLGRRGTITIIRTKG